ncbi:MAG: hypothetical protein IPP71_14025 [Bacteroidetes bacterium]|nr:hypothetical protein [Bacteroidota bacterium]
MTPSILASAQMVMLWIQKITPLLLLQETFPMIGRYGNQLTMELIGPAQLFRISFTKYDDASQITDVDGDGVVDTVRL